MTEELFDVLDNNGRHLGRVCTRSIAHRHGYVHATIHVWVMNFTGDILLQKRSMTKDTHPGLWDISCAGHVNAGETAINAAVRELYEELGLSVDCSVLRFLFSNFQSYASSDGTIHDNEFSDVYLLTIKSDQILRFDPQEIDAIKFVTIDTLKKMIDSADPLLVPHNEEYHKLIDIVSVMN